MPIIYQNTVNSIIFFFRAWPKFWWKLPYRVVVPFFSPENSKFYHFFFFPWMKIIWVKVTILYCGAKFLSKYDKFIQSFFFPFMTIIWVKKTILYCGANFLLEYSKFYQSFLFFSVHDNFLGGSYHALLWCQFFTRIR